MPKCKHEIEEETCAFCKPRPGSIEEKEVLDDGLLARLGPQFTARYRGSCAVCGKWYASGSQIARHPELPRYVGPCCL